MRRKVIISLSSDEDIDNVDLIESDSEDSDYDRKRKKGIASRTREIGNRIMRFFRDVELNTSIKLDKSHPLGRKRRRSLTFHISMLGRNEQPDDRVKCFISYAKRGKMLCNVLLGAGLMELEPKDGDVICHPDVGVRLTRMASSIKGRKSFWPSQDQVESFSRSLTEKLYAGNVPICRIFLPIDLNNNHWGLLVVELERGVRGAERRILRFGDSLRYDCPLYIKRFFKEVVDRCFPPRAGTTWIYGNENYILDVLKYEMQEDGVSCGPYVISAIAEASRSRGCMPKDTYRLGYNMDTTEKYRWGCVEARVSNILDATLGNGVLPSNEFLVDAYVLKNRKNFFERRRKRVTNRKTRIVESKKRKASDLGHGTPRQKPSKALKLSNSKYAAESVIAGILDALPARSSAVSGGKDVCVKEQDGSDELGLRRKRQQNRKRSNAEVEREHSFPRKLFELTRRGHAYGLHNCLISINNRHKQYLSIRLRCLKYLEPWKCKAAVTGKLLADKKVWEMRYSLAHNHDETKITTPEAIKRVTKVCSSVLFQVPKDERKELEGTLSLNLDDQTERQSDVRENPACSSAHDDECSVPDVLPRIFSVTPSVGLSPVSRDGQEQKEGTATPHEETGRHCNSEQSRGCKDENEMDINDGGAEGDCNVTDVRAEEALPPLESFFDCLKYEDEKCNTHGTAEGVVAKESDHESEVEKGVKDFAEDKKRNDYFEHSVALSSITSYIESVPLNTPGRHVLLQVQFISEGFGYDLAVRHSGYHDQSAEVDSQRVLQRAIIHCKKQDGIEQCPFSLIVKTVVALGDAIDGNEREEANGSARQWRYIYNSSRAIHNHEPDLRVLRKCLPPQAQEEAMKMHNILRMGYNDVLRYLEDRYNIIIDREVLRQHLKYLNNKNSPRDQDCFRLAHALSTLQEQNPRHRTFFSTTGSNSMHCTAWILEEWVEDYKSYGIIPGVSIDCKAIANRFSYPLFSINGRTSSGQVCTFCMGFVPSETEESFIWMLEKFMSVMPVSPAMVVVDQNAAIMAAVRRVLPNSFLVLDEWHVNKNQLKNVGAWCSSISRTDWCSQMNNDLHGMRRSSCRATFEERRAAFEDKYFTAFEKPIPRWYAFLYRSNPSLIVAFHRNIKVPARFIFQGTGYSEAANSMFRHHILRRKIPIYHMPQAMLELTRKRRTRMLNLLQNKNSYLRQLSTASIGLSSDDLHTLCHDHTAYALHKFLTMSVQKSSRYHVAECDITTGSTLSLSRVTLLGILEQPSTLVAIFKVVRIPNPQLQNPARDHHVYCCKVSVTDSSNVAHRGFCTCLKHTSNGFPCAHMTRVATVYAEELSRTPALESAIGSRYPIEELWHPYWKTNPDAWTITQIAAMRAVMGAQPETMNLSERNSHKNPDERPSSVGNSVNESTPNPSAEISSFVSFAHCNAISTQMHRVASALGPIALVELKKFFDSGLAALNAGLSPLNPNIALTTVGADLLTGTTSNTPRITPETVQNPNAGRDRSRKRKRSFTENIP